MTTDVRDEGSRTRGTTRRASIPRATQRLTLAVAALGLLGAVVFVVLEGHTHTVPGQTPPSRWFGTLGAVAPSQRAFDALAAWAAILALGGCWLVLVRLALQHRLRLRLAAGIAALWSAPFALGPPLTSLDLYSYAAHGWLSRSGRSPYEVPPAALGDSPVLHAVDPRWHGVLSPYGPVATLAERIAATVGHTPLGTVVAIRVLGSVAAVVAVVAAVALTRPETRPRTLVLLGLNPLFLTTTFSAGHLEATMLALLLCAVYAFRHNRPVLALVLAVAAGLVKVPALGAVPFFVVEHWRAAPTRRARVAARDVGVTVLSLAAGGLLVPHGWGWTSSVLHTPAIGREWWTPSTLLAEIGTGAAHLVGLSASLPALLNVTRGLGLLATAVLLTWLLFRPGDPVLRLGLGLSALAVLGFVLYPWYLLWGWPLVLVSAGRRLAVWSSVAVGLFTLANAWPQRREVSAFFDGVAHHPATSVLALAAVVVTLGALVRLLVAGAPEPA